ncbi:MAG TPA: hypothetical protein VGL17_13975 [Gemmatimonadaceae bacterium]
MRDDPRKNATFDGTIPEMYDRFLGPLLFEPFAIDLAGRVGTLKPGKREAGSGRREAGRRKSARGGIDS